MKRVLSIALGIILFYAAPVVANISTKDNLELMTSFGPVEMGQVAGWISADLSIATAGEEQKSVDEFSLLTGFFNFFDYSDVPLQPLLFWEHTRYFVSVFGEAEVAFSVLYRDPFDNPPSTGYPKVTYWPQGTCECSTVSLEFSSLKDGGTFYAKTLVLPVGDYAYRYSAKHDQITEEYALEVSSFVVTKRPGICENRSSLTESSTVSNAKVVLQWDPPAGGGDGLTYKLFFGTDPGILSLAYEGSFTRHEVSSLDYGKKYYWQIEACDRHGVSSRTPVYRFSTISLANVSRSYNYPNPFNPALAQKTNILFNMTDPGSAELSIYTELGDLCWQRTFDNLAKGANEISYDGKDDQGQTLYNGTYVCFIKKKYPDKEEKENCRLMVIK